VIELLKSAYPIRLLCDLLAVSRRSFYYQPRQADEPELREAVAQLAAQFPTYGSRRLAQQKNIILLLRRAPFQWRVNNKIMFFRKRVQRLMQELDLPCRVKRRTIHTTDSRQAFPRYPNLVRELKIIRPHQVWVSDITYIHLREEFIYLAIIMAVFTRIIHGWQLGYGLGGELTLSALTQALTKGVPEIHHSDQGLPYAATEYTHRLQQAGVQISMAEVGQSAQNGYAERLIRTIKEEEVDLNDYADLEDARRQIGRFIDEVYLSKRIHNREEDFRLSSSLGYLTPAEFEAQWHKQQRASASSRKKG
jgi:putative transposase